MIETVSGNLPHPEIYLRRQPDPHLDVSLLDVSLLDVFTDVVEFSVRAFQYFGLRWISGSHSANAARELLLTFRNLGRLFRLMRFPFTEQFGDIMDRMRRHSREADENARAIEMLRSVQFRSGNAHSPGHEYELS